MNRYLFAALVLVLAFCGRDGLRGQDKPVPFISLELRAQYWRYAAELQQAQAILRDAKDHMNAVLAKLREVCKGDIEMDKDGEPACKPMETKP